MFHTRPKRIIILLALLVNYSMAVSAQDFYKDYRAYLLSEKWNKTAGRKAYIDTSIKRLRLTTDTYEKENGHSFFTPDTVFLVGSFNPETSATLEIVWNKNASCYYERHFEDVPFSPHSKPLSVFNVKTNGATMLKSFGRKFLQTLTTIDTAFYHQYANKHQVFDGASLSAIVCVRIGKRWKFINFQGDGEALCDFYDEEMRIAEIRKRPPVTLPITVDSTIIKYLHFNIDSAKRAYENDPDKANKQPAFPIIVLNDKVVDFSYLKVVELNEVTSIRVFSGSDPKAAEYGGSKYGFVVITTNGKRKY